MLKTIYFIIKKLGLLEFILQNQAISKLIGYYYLFVKKQKPISKRENFIFIAQTIFAKDEWTLNLNIKSIQSLGKYLKKYPPNIDYQLAFSGWAYDKTARKKVEAVLYSEFGNNMYIKEFKENEGKSTFINELMADFKQLKRTALFTFDSDIIFSEDCPDLFDRMIYSIEIIEKEKNQQWGIIAPLHVASISHWMNVISQRSISYLYNDTYEERLGWGYLPIGIAGSCWMISRELWDITKGYTYFGKFGPEDGIMLKQCGEKGFSWQVLESTFVIHPNLSNLDYRKYKTSIYNNISE